MSSVQDPHGSVEYRPFVSKLWGKLQGAASASSSSAGAAADSCSGGAAGGAAPAAATLHMPQFVAARQRRLQTHVALALNQQPDSLAAEAAEVAQLPTALPWRLPATKPFSKKVFERPEEFAGGGLPFCGGDPKAAEVGRALYWGGRRAEGLNGVCWWVSVGRGRGSFSRCPAGGRTPACLRCDAAQVISPTGTTAQQHTAAWMLCQLHLSPLPACSLQHSLPPPACPPSCSICSSPDPCPSAGCRTVASQQEPRACLGNAEAEPFLQRGSRGARRRQLPAVHAAAARGQQNGGRCSPGTHSTRWLPQVGSPDPQVGLGWVDGWPNRWHTQRGGAHSCPAHAAATCSTKCTDLRCRPDR